MLAQLQPAVLPEDLAKWLAVAATVVGLITVFHRGVKLLKNDLVERMDKQDKRMDAIEARATAIEARMVAQVEKLGDKIDRMLERRK